MRLTQTNGPIQSVEQTVLPLASPFSFSDPEVTAYMRRTEKEMKKLLREKQKMREFARKADDENAKLKRLLGDAQRENRRLISLLATSETRIQNALSAAGSKVFPQHQKTTSTPSQPDDNRHPKNFDQAVKQNDIATQSRQGEQHTSGSAKSPRPNSVSIETEIHHLGNSNAASLGTLKPSTSVNVNSPLTNLAFRLEGGPPPPSTAQRTRMPPDRIKDIRRRLSAKAEKRKASLASQVEGSAFDFADFEKL